MSYCLRYNTSVAQQQMFKNICKVLLTKSKSLLERIEKGDWVHISVVSHKDSTIKVYFDGMFDSTVLKHEDFLTNSDLLHYCAGGFEIKGYVALDTSVDRV